MFVELRKAELTFKSMDSATSNEILFIMLCMAILTFNSLEETLLWDYDWNESYSGLFSLGTVSHAIRCSDDFKVHQTLVFDHANKNLWAVL